MKKMKFWLGALSMAFFALLIPMGCDNGGAGDNGELDAYFKNHPYVSDPRNGGISIVTLSPATVSLSTVGERAVFQFTGGTAPYTWDVSDSSKGSISGSGAQGVYTVIAVGANDVIAYDHNGNAAIAKISGDISSTTNATLGISPSDVTLNDNNSLVSLTASGGTGPYSWGMTYPSRGELPNGDTGTSVVYRRTAAGDNAVTVTDSLGAIFNIVIHQP